MHVQEGSRAANSTNKKNNNNNNNNNQQEEQHWARNMYGSKLWKPTIETKLWEAPEGNQGIGTACQHQTCLKCPEAVSIYVHIYIKYQIRVTIRLEKQSFRHFTRKDAPLNHSKAHRKSMLQSMRKSSNMTPSELEPSRPQNQTKCGAKLKHKGCSKQGSAKTRFSMNPGPSKLCSRHGRAHIFRFSTFSK